MFIFSFKYISNSTKIVYGSLNQTEIDNCDEIHICYDAINVVMTWSAHSHVISARDIPER